jgi:DnaJ like chaperone protein
MFVSTGRFSPMMRTIIIIAALLYALLPYDLLPDVLAGWGWLDDAVVLGLLLRYLYVYRKRTQQAGRFGESFRGTSSSAGQSTGDRHQQTDSDAEKPRDPHDVLGVRRGASQQELKNAYRELVNKYHPDKVSHLGDEFQKLAEIRFKEIQQAYQELKNP